MPSFIRTTAGGKAISGGALQPRGRRGNTAQVADYWAGSGPAFMIATGGTTTDYTVGGINYRSHEFTSSGTFTVTQLGDIPTVDVLVVAGGGGGGSDRAGGGGAGGFRTTTQTLTSATGYTVTVGAGGPNLSGGSRGGTSSFVGSSTFSATGGGSGDFLAGSYVGATSGGSGGGGYATAGAAGNAGGYTPVEGYAGGNQTDSVQGGAGGGAGGVGGGSGAGNTAGATNDYKTGSNITYANGGGGGSSGSTTSANLGSGRAAFSATAARAGVVVIRYRVS